MQKISNFILLDDKYQIDMNTKIGSGAYGNVYLGCYYKKSQQTEINQDNELLAIKEIPINSKFETTDALLREINLLRMMKNTNIVR